MRLIRVLYVENDPALCAMITTMLNADFGLSITAAVGSPNEALAIATRGDFDVALLDISLGQEIISEMDLDCLACIVKSTASPQPVWATRQSHRHLATLMAPFGRSHQRPIRP